MEVEQPYLWGLLTMVINHLLSGMNLQVVHDEYEEHLSCCWGTSGRAMFKGHQWVWFTKRKNMDWSYLLILKEEQLVNALDFTNTYPLAE